MSDRRPGIEPVVVPPPPPPPVGPPKRTTEVPDLPCRKCGHITTMRYCWPAAWDFFGTYFATCTQPDEHMHRECGRCGFKWISRDVLSEPEARAERYDQEARFLDHKGEKASADHHRMLAAEERLKVAP